MPIISLSNLAKSAIPADTSFAPDTAGWSTDPERARAWAQQRPSLKEGWKIARRLFGALCAIFLLPAFYIAANAPAAETPIRPSLQQATDQLKIPPAWFDTTVVHWDTNKPWKDARLEVRRLLGRDEPSIQEAVKITWLYAQKGDIGDGHELSMYLFMSGNYAWAALEFPKYLKTVKSHGATHAYLSFASCLEHFGEFQRALAVLNQALEDLPAPPWRVASLANIHNHLGDFYSRTGKFDQAKASYDEAMRLYARSDQPYGRHLLPRYVAKVQSKLDLLTMRSLQISQLRDGTYTGKSLGYADSKDLEVYVTIRGGRIIDVRVNHEEKIELNATQIIPYRIRAEQSLHVDGVTGATVTSQAILEAVFQALKQAGAK